MQRKRGQLKISFGMIFSIILIIAFIAVAIYAIIMFLNLKKCSETGLFKKELQGEIDRAWNSEETSTIFRSKLPSGIEKVCFIDLEAGFGGEYQNEYEDIDDAGIRNVNMFFYPLKNACEGQAGFMIEHINITRITESNNPYCIEVENGNIEVGIEKGFYDAQVKVR